MTGHTQQKAPAVLPQGTLQLQQTRQRWQGSTLVPRIKSRLAQATDVVSKQASQARLLQQTVRPAQWENNATQAAEGRLARTHLTLESKTDSASRKSSLQPFKPSPAYAPLRPALALGDISPIHPGWTRDAHPSERVRALWAPGAMLLLTPGDRCADASLSFLAMQFEEVPG